MTNTYDHIFFDLDGTLCDSTLGIDKGVIFALKKMGIEENESGVKKIIGLPLHVSLRKFYFDNENDAWKAVHLFREYYSKKGLYESHLYYGIKTMLKQLSNHAFLHIITAKPTPYAIEVAKFHSIEKYFKSINGCSLDGGEFSKDIEIKKILKNKEKTNAVMVGDRAVDIEAGKKNEIDTIAVLYGYGNKKELIQSEPTKIVKNVRDLKMSLI